MWIVKYGMKPHVVLDMKMEFSSKLFAMLCVMREVNDLATTESHFLTKW